MLINLCKDSVISWNIKANLLFFRFRHGLRLVLQNRTSTVLCGLLIRILSVDFLLVYYISFDLCQKFILFAQTIRSKAC